MGKEDAYLDNFHLHAHLHIHKDVVLGLSLAFYLNLLDTSADLLDAISTAQPVDTVGTVSRRSALAFSKRSDERGEI